MDILLTVISAGLFVLSILYVRMCERLKGKR